MKLYPLGKSYNLKPLIQCIKKPMYSLLAKKPNKLTINYDTHNYWLTINYDTHNYWLIFDKENRMHERSDVEHPMWRKKVDKSLLKSSQTPIPKWLWSIWDITSVFGDITSKKNPSSHVTVTFQGEKYVGYVTYRKSTDMYFLSFDKCLSTALNGIYLMSYMRILETELTDGKTFREVEKDISFWEFLDIECNINNKEFKFSPYFTVQPQFPNLFKRMIGSASMKAVGDSILKNSSIKIHKQDWKPRAEYSYELGAKNVIYMLLDTKSELLYVGETKELIPRFDNGHPDIKDWDYYKYSVLPEELEDYRVELERMLIRDMATILKNKKNIPNISISEYKLANRKIDT